VDTTLFLLVRVSSLGLKLDDYRLYLFVKPPSLMLWRPAVAAFSAGAALAASAGLAKAVVECLLAVEDQRFDLSRIPRFTFRLAVNSL
jgi:hypothetical protein